VQLVGSATPGVPAKKPVAEKVLAKAAAPVAQAKDAVAMVVPVGQKVPAVAAD